MRPFAVRLGRKLFQFRGMVPIPVFLGALVIAGRTPPHLDALARGGLVVIFGEATRLWAAMHIENYRTNRVGAPRLATTGPYAYTRNPLYIGNLLLWMGVLVSAGTPWSAPWVPAAALCYFVVEYGFIIHAEEDKLRRMFRSSYAEYSRRVGRIIPRSRYRGGSRPHIGFAQALRRERTTLALLLIYAIVIVVIVKRA